MTSSSPARHFNGREPEAGVCRETGQLHQRDGGALFCAQVPLQPPPGVPITCLAKQLSNLQEGTVPNKSKAKMGPPKCQTGPQSEPASAGSRAPGAPQSVCTPCQAQIKPATLGGPESKNPNALAKTADVAMPVFRSGSGLPFGSRNEGRDPSLESDPRSLSGFR